MGESVRREAWPRLAAELASDYRAHYRDAPATGPRAALVALLRFLTNPSLHAVTLLRVANRAPAWSRWIWRQLLVSKHGMDWSGPLEIGPGLWLPHPVGIVMSHDVRLGRDVTLCHNVSIGGDAQGRAPVIGDGVTIYPGAVIIGPRRIGDRAVIGANSFVSEDVPADTVYKRGATEPLRESAITRAARRAA
jgi:serine O-acetyltransferase